MIFPTAKELKKLATACRKAGIKSFKCEGFEVTFTDDLPLSNKKQIRLEHNNNEMKEVIAADFEEEALTQDQLLMWSAAQMPDEDTLTA